VPVWLAIGPRTEVETLIERYYGQGRSAMGTLIENSMSRRFTFSSLRNDSDGSNEANIFIHGYSAGHNVEDRQTLLASVPESIRNHTNIFAFWPSSHFPVSIARQKHCFTLQAGCLCRSARPWRLSIGARIFGKYAREPRRWASRYSIN